MTIHLPDARQQSDEVVQALRLRAIHACQLGYAETDVAAILGVARETVSRWWSAYQRGGTAALPEQRSGRPVGSGRTLDDEQAERIQQLLEQYHPEDVGIAAPLWTRRAVRDLIAQELGLQMPVRTVGDYLERWGYSPQKPERQRRDQDPDEVQQWLDETYPALEEKAQQEEGEIQWGDETGVAVNEYRGRGYAPVGQTPQLRVSSGRWRVNVVATVTNTGQVRFMTYKENLTGTLFIEFLRRLVAGAERKIFLVLDPSSIHMSAEVSSWVAAHAEQIELWWLPRAAPELNPVEYLNNDLKGSVHAERLPATKSELRSTVQSYMHKLAKLPERIIHYFQHPNIQYAADLV